MKLRTVKYGPWGVESPLLRSPVKSLGRGLQGRRADIQADAQVVLQAETDANAPLATLAEVSPHESEESGVIMCLDKRYGLVAGKRKAAAATDDLAFEVCGFNFEEAYGELGEGYIEFHDTKRVHTLLAGPMTQLNDLALLCANGHRMAHRKRLHVDVATLR